MQEAQGRALKASPPADWQKRYFIFFCKASPRLAQTLYANFVKLPCRKTRPQTAQSDVEHVLAYIKNIRKHATPGDAQQLAGLVACWQASQSLDAESEQEALRILDSMHENHCHYLRNTALAMEALRDARRHAHGSKDIVDDLGPDPREWSARGCTTLAMQLEDAEIVRDLDEAVLQPASRWKWTQEIDFFFDGP
jgi:hypothetical protein